MRLTDVLTVLRAVAPEHLAETWDKVGLHVGSERRRVRRALLCIDLTEPVMAEAVAHKCDLIVAYHPPIFRPLGRLTDRTWKERVIVEAVRRKIAVYSPHTALDNARGGITEWLCDGLGPHRVRFTISHRVSERVAYKIVTFAPPEAADQVREAMRHAGAGWADSAMDRAYHAQGFGTRESASEDGPMARFDELRVEMTCAPDSVGTVLRAIRRAHPEDEPVIDIYPLAPERPPEDDAPGAGRVHHLARPVTAATLVKRIKRLLGVASVKVAAPTAANPHRDSPEQGKLQSIAVCPGAGGSLFERCPMADAYLTGEMQHHQVLDMTARGQLVILAGHSNTERPYLPVYRDRLVAAGAEQVEWHISEADRAPFAIL